VAIGGQEVELLGVGTEDVAPTHGAFALNMVFESEAWRVRSGFGTVSELDTTLSMNIGTGEFGYRKHMGSRLIMTSFGHEQIVSVFCGECNTSNSADNTRIFPLYLVSIYDLTTDTRWEEPLYRHTGELDPDTQTPDFQYGHYDSDKDFDHQRWVNGNSEDYFYFAESNLDADTDVLFFGTKAAGLWCYVPGIIRKSTHKFVDAINQHAYSSPRAESSMVIPVTLVVPEDQTGQSYQYFRHDEVTGINVVARFGKRLVYALDRAILFSDMGGPARIVTDNYVIIPSEYSITALADVAGQLLIFTSNETFVYQPSTGDIAANGRLVPVSDTVGCVGPSAMAEADGALFFVDSNGVYVYSGNLDVKLASGDIDDFFAGSISNPLSSYFSYSGYTPMQTEQPHTSMYFKPNGVNAIYSPSLRALLITIPEQNITLCLAGSKWSVWSYTSSVYYAAATGGGGGTVTSSYPGIMSSTDNPNGYVTEPWLATSQDDLFLVGSTSVQSLTDELQITSTGSAVDVDDDVKPCSYYLLRYGRGGGIDRSIRDEDDRFIAGKYITRIFPNIPATTFYADKWLPVPKGFTFPNGYVVTDYSSVWLVPISLVPSPGLMTGNFFIEQFRLRLRFDNTKWQPVCEGANQSSPTNAFVDFLLPSERISSAAGYFNALGITMSDGQQVQVYDTVGAVDFLGYEIRVEWNGLGKSGWTHNDAMNLNPAVRNPIIYLPMRLESPASNVSGMAMWAPATSAAGNDGGAHNCPFVLGHDIVGTAYTTASAGVFVWEQWVTGSRRTDDSVAQPVDWAFKSPRIGTGEQGQKARGLWTRILSHGKGTVADWLQQNWLYGLFNIAVASEEKGWLTQVMDVDATNHTVAYEEYRSKTTLRTHVADSGTLYTKTFGAAGNKWGDPDLDNATDGTTLVDDEAVETMSTSLSVKGRSFTYLLFGFIQNRAQVIALESSKVLVRLTGGGRRRRGR